MICVAHVLGIHGILELLIDTGATCSMVKIDHINQEAYLNPNEKLTIGGAFGGQDSTYGSITTTLKFGKEIEKKIKFHVIENTDTIPGDGIIGADFLQDNVIMDCIDHKMYCCDNGKRNLVTISNKFGENKTTLDNMAPWEKYTKGIGQKLLFEQGYRLGAGLGAHGQGIEFPLELEYINNRRKGLGFAQHNKAISYNLYDQHCKSLRNIETEIPLPRTRRIEFEYPETDYTITLKPRSESIVFVRVKEKGKRFCQAVQIRDGVFSSNTIIKSINGYARIAIINTHNEEIKIEQFYPITKPMHYYDKVDPNRQTHHDANIKKLRYEKIIKIVETEGLPPEERSIIDKILLNYHDIFHLPGDKLTYTNVKKFKLPLEENAPIINKKQYRLPEKHRNEVQKQIDKLQNDDIIESSSSPFNSPILLVPKKGTDPEGNKLFRMCVDFRELNKVSIPYSFPLPRIEDILDQLGGSAYFSTLDLSQGFHQILINEADREKTAFSSNYGHYQYKRCPFGLKTLPGFFQSLLNGILSGLQGLKCFVYIDDVVIFSKDLHDHAQRITEVFDRFRTSNIKLNPQKCKFLQKEVKYLGHKCSINGVQPDERLVEAIQEFPVPNTIKKLQSFLGLANYYRQFVKNFARKARPLYELLSGVETSRRKRLGDWTAECDDAFKNLKLALITEPILAYPDFDKEFIITCDASLEGLGAVLEQDKKVIQYASRSLLDTEKNWSATELELNAIVFSWKTFKPYVLGRHVKVYTDHMPLKGILKMKDTASRIVRLQQKLLEFDYEIIYKKGTENGCADFLSRNPISGAAILTIEERRPRHNSHPTIIIDSCSSDESEGDLCQESNTYTVDLPTDSDNEAQGRCTIITRSQSSLQAGTSKNADQPTITTMPTSNQPLTTPDKNHNSAHTDRAPARPQPESDSDWSELGEWDDATDPAITIITRPRDKETVLKDFHDSVFGGHFGVTKTYDRIKKQFYWRGMKSYITKYIANCGKCQRNKVGRTTRMKLCETDLSDRPFDKVYIDLVGPLPVSGSGNKHILSMVDDLTRFVEFAAIPDQTANTVARALYEQILCRYTLPRVIISDNGTNFLSEIFKELGKLLKIDRRQISPFSPQGNLVERQHSTLANYLRCFAETDPTSWDTYLRTAAHAYNNTTHVSTGYSPMELLFGFISEIPSNLKRKPAPLYNHDSYYHELRYKLQTSFSIAREKLGVAKSKSKEYYDKHANPKEFVPGQFAFLKNTNRTNKFSPHWVGPYQIIQIHGALNATIKIGRKVKKVHLNRLKPTRMLN